MDDKTHGARLDRATYSMVLVIYIGTVAMSVVLVLITGLCHIMLGRYQWHALITIAVVAFVYLIGVGLIVHINQHRVAAWLLIVFYAAIATLLICLWGINVPIGILLLAFVIALAGVIVGAESIIPVTIGVGVLLVVLQILTDLGVVRPDTSDLATDANYGDIAGYGTIFAVFAVVMWLSKLRLEYALKRALAAEDALEIEKRSLARRLEEKTRHLKESQLEEMRQLYRFSQLNQNSTALLHELANDLAVLTLDIDALEQDYSSSPAIQYAKKTMSQLDRKIRRLRHHLKESSPLQRFAASTVIHEVIDSLRHKADYAHISLISRSTGPRAYITGDPQKLCQALTIIVTNAIDAAAKESANRPVTLSTSTHAKSVKIQIIDFGPGISQVERDRLFKPFASTKKDGMGIGLFIAKQIIETHFRGNILLEASLHPTVFTIRIPKDNQ